MSSDQMCELDMEPNPPKYSCGFDLGSLAVASDVVYSSWIKISEFRKTLVPKSSSKLVEFKEFELGNFNIVAFVSNPTPEFLLNSGDLVSFEELDDFKFLCSKTNPKFAINRAAMSLFCSVRGPLSNLRDKIADSAKSIPYIIAGQCMGGSVAALFTLWLLDSLDASTTKRPLCITFGSPLLGDRGFQEAVSQCSPWNSCFLHVVHKEDYNSPNLFDSKLHCPFGTYMFCSESGSACFEASASVSVVLKKMKGDSHGSGGGIEEFDYGPVIDRLRGNAIYKDIRKLRVSGGKIDSFKMGTEAQLAATGFQQNMRVNQIVEDEVDARKTEAIDPSKKLNYMKMELAKIEWYKKRTANEGIGYYDSYKKMQDTKDNDMVLVKKTLDTFWKFIMSEAKRKPQNKLTGKKLRKTWKHSGRVYRLMTEPLHIADYYKENKVGRNYVTCGRPGFIHALEELAEELSDDESDKVAVPPTLAERRQIMMDSNMNEDSCFWAHVEEAKLSCESLLTGINNDGEDNKKVLEEFEKYCFEQIEKCGVSREIFLKKSTYMKWWELYEQVLEGNQMGPDHNSSLIDFMRAHHYEDYIKGTYDP